MKTQAPRFKCDCTQLVSGFGGPNAWSPLLSCYPPAPLLMRFRWFDVFPPCSSIQAGAASTHVKEGFICVEKIKHMKKQGERREGKGKRGKGREGKREGQKRKGGDGELFFLKLLLTNLLIFDPMIILQRINF